MIRFKPERVTTRYVVPEAKTLSIPVVDMIESTDIVVGNDHTISADQDISTDGILHGDRSDWTSGDDIPHILSENENSESADAAISTTEDFGNASDLTSNNEDDEDSLVPVSDSHQEPASDNVSSEGLSFGDRSGSSSQSHDDDHPHIL